MNRVKILVTVGSDHHPFDRLIGGVDRWAEGRDDVELTVQFGTAAQPRHGKATAYLPHPDLMAAMRETDILVTQGGPMGIIEARRTGLIPIVWPRLARFGEVVDDHQVDLCRHLGERQEVVLVESEEALHRALESAVAVPAALHITPVDSTAQVRGSVRSFAAEVVDLPPRRGFFGRRAG